MLVYNYIPYPRIVFYVFTVLFHMFLMVRSALEGRYIIASILIIPVVAVSAALYRFLRKSVIKINLTDSQAEIFTAFAKTGAPVNELAIEGKKLTGLTMELLINPAKAEKLKEKLIK